MNANSIYLRLYSVSAINSISDAIAAVALPLAFLLHTGSVGLAASLAAATTLPQLIFAIPLGAIADRLPRRPTIIAGFIAETLLLALLTLLLFTHTASFWPVVLIGALRGLFSQLGVAATAGYVPRMLGRKQLLRYHSRVEVIEGVATIGGPPVAGGVVGWLGGAFAMIVPSVLSALSAVIYFMLPSLPEKSPAPAEGSQDSRVAAQPETSLENQSDSEATKNPQNNPAKSTNFLARLWRDMCDGLVFAVRDSVIRPILLVQFALGVTTTSYALGWFRICTIWVLKLALLA
ncbi:MAG: MFS transporter [Microbacteriaceae bacterium]|nr:MFS transporter [Microbacteriaceae bacterium]